MNINVRFLGLMGIAVLGAGFGGCSQTTHQERNAILEFKEGDFTASEATLKGPASKKDENYVLNNCRLGSAALAAGDLTTAETAFFNAYQVINSGDTNDPGRAMQATVVFEGAKVFKGEPFERAMAHYYLGMIYLVKHDYQNARAAFQNSNFQVAQYAKKDNVEEYSRVQSKFALGYFGLGYTNLRLGRADLAQQNFQLAVQADPRLQGLVQAVQQPGVNTLIFVDSGTGPRKAAKGWYNEESAFGPTPAEVGPVPAIQAFADGHVVSAPIDYSTVDTLALAQERSWQDIDTVKKVKAVAGTGLMAAGAGATAYGADRNDKGFIIGGLAAMGAGALLSASSQSDVRYWEMLPRSVYVIPASLTPGQHQIYVQAGGNQSAVLTTTVAPPAPGAVGDNVYYFRLR